MEQNEQYDAVIVGAGFTGLTAGMALSEAGQRVLIVEADPAPGGLAGTFRFEDGTEVEKFYHHWFNNDTYVNEIVTRLGMEDQVKSMPSLTGMYFNKKIWRLSSPLDLLKFTPLGFWDRIRLGLLVLRVRLIKDWKRIEGLSIEEWLAPICGRKVYDIVWRPLIDSKFSIYAKDVSAVWMWKKLALRGSSRKKDGREELSYFKGGFGRLAEAMAAKIQSQGGTILYNTAALSVEAEENTVSRLHTTQGDFTARNFLFTPALPQIARILENKFPAPEIAALDRVRYLGNICLVLQLNKSLSDTYWLNVNDPGFPFVGVIEHTNFDDSDHYKGHHIVYLSRYLPVSDELWAFSDGDYYEYALSHLTRMFPDFGKDWVVGYGIWRAPYAQPVTERHYSSMIPPEKLSFTNAYISTMAQIYPEDRGTNYAIRNGFAVAKKMMS